MTESKTILFISSEFPPGPGGIGNHGFNLVKALIRKGYHVETISNMENSTTEEAFAFDQIHQIKVYRAKRGFIPIQFIRFKLAFSRAFKNKKTTIILSGKFSLWTGALLSFLIPKNRFIAVIHGSEINLKNRFSAWLTRVSLRQFKHIVSVSHFTKDLINPKYSFQKHIVIPNAIDTNYLKRFSEIDYKKLAGNPSLLTVGNVSYRKGQMNVVKALPEIIKSFPDAHYHCVGLPGKANEVKQLAEQLGVSKHITLHGKLPEMELFQSFKGCDIFIMLSEIVESGDFEGFGIAILEANFFGKPAIGSSNCGIEDAIDQNYNGIKVPYNDPFKITEAILNIVKSPEMEEQSKEWAMRHDWDKVVERYIPIIEETL